jgi:hypothetical protein
VFGKRADVAEYGEQSDREQGVRGEGVPLNHTPGESTQRAQACQIFCVALDGTTSYRRLDPTMPLPSGPATQVEPRCQASGRLIHLVALARDLTLPRGEGFMLPPMERESLLIRVIAARTGHTRKALRLYEASGI